MKYDFQDIINIRVPIRSAPSIGEYRKMQRRVHDARTRYVKLVSSIESYLYNPNVLDHDTAYLVCDTGAIMVCILRQSPPRKLYEAPFLRFYSSNDIDECVGMSCHPLAVARTIMQNGVMT